MNKTVLLIVMAIGGCLWGIPAFGDMFDEKRRLHKAPTDRMSSFKVSVVLSTLFVVAVFVGSLYAGSKIYVACAAKQNNVTSLPVVLFSISLLIVCKIITQHSLHIFELCTFSIPLQRKIDLHGEGVRFYYEGDYEKANWVAD